MKKLSLLFVFVVLAAVGFANKTSVKVDAPAKAAKGEEMTVTINVMHNGNSKMHHTDWVTLSINGKEVKKWEYNPQNLPENGNFTVQYKFTPDTDATITAQGDCNLHGSAGPNTATVKVE